MVYTGAFFKWAFLFSTETSTTNNFCCIWISNINLHLLSEAVHNSELNDKWNGNNKYGIRGQKMSTLSYSATYKTKIRSKKIPFVKKDFGSVAQLPFILYGM